MTAFTMHLLASGGEVIPSNTPMILKANQSVYDFSEQKEGVNPKYVTLSSSSDGTAVEEQSNNLMGVQDTTLTTTLRGGENNVLYVLSNRTSDSLYTGIGFYKLSTSVEKLAAHKAYAKLVVSNTSSTTDQVSAPMRRLSFDFSAVEETEEENGTNVAMGTESIQSLDVSTQKIIRNGQLYILRGEHVYNAQGQIVK